MLIGASRYNPNKMAETVRLIRAAFQIRHTLSHNQGFVTVSDSAKFRALGFAVEGGDVIDPSSELFGALVGEFLLDESAAFTDWLLGETAKFLADQQKSKHIALLASERDGIERLLGKNPAISALVWV